MKTVLRLLPLAPALALCAAAFAADPAPPLPQRLHETGLYAEGSTGAVREGIIAFSPRYPLWSDGTSKRRWLYLPPGAAIDASRPDAWEFPPGTKAWKEFSYERRLETRYIKRLADGSWRFAAYVWNAEGTEARLAPEHGAIIPAAGAPGARYTVPSRTDCLACHEAAAAPILGYSAVQLAPHIEGRNEVERAALGYLHGNCGHCHNDNGSPVPVDLVLWQKARENAKVLRSLLGAPSRYRAPGAPVASAVVEPGRPEASVLMARMRSRNPQTQMPPLGTQETDNEALALIERWIRTQPQTRKEH